jgi:hypothetical protein
VLRDRVMSSPCPCLGCKRAYKKGIEDSVAAVEALLPTSGMYGPEGGLYGLFNASGEYFEIQGIVASIERVKP